MKILTKYKHLIVTLAFFIVNTSYAFAQGCSFEDCPGSVMSDITAAFATEGYWLLADVVWQIENTNMGLWAPLIYILAYAAAGIMLAMGQPPKNYVWFFLGPAFYSWLVFTPAGPVKGVGWRIVNEPADQSIVWRKSEVGLLNTNRSANPSKDSAPENSIELPWLFLWVDELVSSTIQHLSAWTGVFRKLENSGSTYTHKAPVVEEGAGEQGVARGSIGNENIAWYLLSHSKWPMLESITQAKLSNHNTREAFISFLSSECGDIFFENINKTLYINSANATGRNLPTSIFGEGTHSTVNENLGNATSIAPSAIRELLKDEGINTGSASGDSFLKFLGGNIAVDQIETFKVLDCNIFFGLIFEAFRWEAGHMYNQIIRQVGGEYQIPKEQINYDFLYGWAVAVGGDPTQGYSLEVKEQETFIINLILMHLIRNEFAFAPGQINKRWTQTEHNIDYAETYQKDIGSKTKYGEMYTWTKLMPYIQGILLYFLTAAYPFACMLMVVPGWHKTLFTWIGFFTWAKSWDVGFAMVGQLEKSIWAMLSNSDNDAVVNGRVHEISFFNEIQVKCSGNSGGENGGLIDGLGCPEPTITDVSQPGLEELIRIVDYSLTLSGNLNMDLQNSYYIYLMSALYFGVPAVTGQLFLGARAGASSMVNTMIGGASQEASRGTTTGFQSDNAAKLKANMATGRQAAFGKSMRNTGLALRSLQNQNNALSNDLGSSTQATKGGLLDMKSQQIGANAKDLSEATNAAAAFGGLTYETIMSSKRALQGGGGGGDKGKVAPKLGEAAPGGAGVGGGGAGAGAPNAAGDGKEVPNLLPNIFTNGVDGGKAAMGTFLKGGSKLAFGQGVNLQNSRDVAQLESGIRLKKAGSSLQGFNFGAMSKGQNATGQRYDALANHQAQEDAWNYDQGFANAIAGNASIATGLSPGSISAPDQRSTNMMGMAGTGFLGKGAKTAFGYSDDTTSKGYYGQVMRAQEGLRTLASKDQLAFKPTSLAAAGGAMPRQAARFVGNAMKGAGNGDLVNGVTPIEKELDPKTQGNAELFKDDKGNFDLRGGIDRLMDDHAKK